MNNQHHQHRRRSIRLRHHDYTRPGAYFVTVCTRNRECLFGEITDGKMWLNEYGRIVQRCWDDLTNHYPRLALDTFIIMPNHVHGVIVIMDTAVGAGFKPAPTNTMKRHGLFEIIRAFKTFSARGINAIRGTPGIPVWQRNYYERVIRDDAELNEIRQYIIHNPVNWLEDENHPGWTKSKVWIRRRVL